MKAFGRKIQPLTINDKPTGELGELLGLFAADGCFYVDRRRYHYTMTISLSSYQNEYAEVVSEIITRVFGRKARIDVHDDSISVVLRGKGILPFLKKYLWWRGRRTYTIRFTDLALGMNKNFLRGIIRGLVAGDGSIYVPRRRVLFGVVSKRLAEQYTNLLREFGVAARSSSVSYKDKKTLHNVNVNTESEVKKFGQRIGLTDPVKRRLLDQALRR